MNLTVDVQVASQGHDAPDPESIRSWVRSALDKRADESQEVEVCVRIVDENESQALNNQYRQKNKPTNVLSFPSEMPEGLPILHLGDIVICSAVVKREAEEQGKSTRAHWAHMVIHGTLHLLGFDHIDEADAVEMENLETQIMVGLLFPPPYQMQSQQQ